MTAPAAVAPSGVDTGRAVRRTRATLLWVGALVVGGLLIALAAGTPAPEDYLHPDGTGQSGTRALVEVLRDRGIDVEVVSTAEDAVNAAGDGTGTTVVVGNSDLLTDAAAQRLLAGTRAADRVVLLDGAPGVLDSLGLGVTVQPPTESTGAADCSLPWVHGDERLDRDSWAIVPTGDALPDGARGCWPTAGIPGGDPDAPGATAYAAVDLPAGQLHSAVTVVGFPDAATNRFVTDADHAALVLRLLGGSPHLVWYHPDYEDVAANPSTTEDAVWPAWTVPGLVVIGLAFVAFALARGRRLGRLVPEDLPVVVRAAETTESRAELYRAAADRHRAAAVLRRATARRLATRVGVAVGAPPDTLVPADRGGVRGRPRGGRPAPARSHPHRRHRAHRARPAARPPRGEGPHVMTDTPTTAAPPAPDARAALVRVREEVAKAVVGQDAAVAGMLVALLCRGHILLEGVPGVAKTLLVRSLAASLDVGTKRVQFTPDLMPGDLTGSLVYDTRESDFSFRPGPVFTNLLLADEINRTPPKTQSALLEAMEERQVSVDGTAHPLPSPFLVAATQNPVEYEGTYPLPEAQLDRFLLKVVLPVPERDDEVTVLRRHAEGFDPRDLMAAGIRPVAGAADVEAGVAAVRTVEVSQEVIGYVVDIARATRTSPSLALGVSPRGATALMATSRAWAWLSGRGYVTPDDVKALAVATLAHRLMLRPEAELEGTSVTSVLHSVLASVPVPR